MDNGQTVDLLLRGAAIGAQLGLGLALARSARNPALRLATLLFITSNICFLLNDVLRGQPGPLPMLLWLMQIGGAGFLWLFIVTLFEDRPLRLSGFGPAAALTLIGIAGRLSGPDTSPWVWGVHNAVGLALAVHAVHVITRSARYDLVEARRRLRVPLLVTMAGYSVLLSAVQLGQGLGVNAGWYQLANAGIQALLGIGAVAVLLEARPVLFGAAVAEAAPSPAADPAPSLWLERLRLTMEEQALWRREGLTIAELAAAVGLPEHRLRRLINDQLGHRNFAAFVNQRRIEEARRLLADPAQAARTVASIAYDLGFGSLGPFNRAFREATGQTPTDFRRTALETASPIPENPR